VVQEALREDERGIVACTGRRYCTSWRCRRGFRLPLDWWLVAWRGTLSDYLKLSLPVATWSRNMRRRESALSMDFQVSVGGGVSPVGDLQGCAERPRARYVAGSALEPRSADHAPRTARDCDDARMREAGRSWARGGRCLAGVPDGGAPSSARVDRTGAAGPGTGRCRDAPGTLGDGRT